MGKSSGGIRGSRRNKNNSTVSNLKGVNLDNPTKEDLSKIQKEIEKNITKMNQFRTGAKFKFVKFEKNYAGEYDFILDTPLQKNVRQKWATVKAQLKKYQ